ncbi:hypothetical protein Taro_024924 [Colocasia esculenta]|uniref:Uncharacterized protein n=1 Tax=Colocasia esculenta TaxID=4460 RepID=A0A843VIX2_COLES|nr:hypothetical protein [Colocasia esculenta]
MHIDSRYKIFWEQRLKEQLFASGVRSKETDLDANMDLEEALSEVAFKDGIPDIKFSKVLGKIWSIALKYHFRMPPYYTLVLRSLASLEGLAITSDQDFRAFQAAYPFVVQKLLYDNSTAARKILYSGVQPFALI